MTLAIDKPVSQLKITRPDDWHLHVRDGEALQTVVPHTAAQFGRAIIMPNLRPPVTTAAQAVACHERIQAAVPLFSCALDRHCIQRRFKGNE